MGIQQNEFVDLAAKSASRDPDLCISKSKVPHVDMKKPIRDYTMQKWQERWTSPDLRNNRKYRKIRPSVSFWSSSFQKNRRTERILTRLRIGHTRVTHSFLFEGTTPPECEHCQVQLTVEHILVHCTFLQEKRCLYHMDGKQIEEILGEDCDIEDITSFLKDTGFYFKL